MVTIPKNVGVNGLKNTLVLELYICWCYQTFNVSKCT